MRVAACIHAHLCKQRRDRLLHQVRNIGSRDVCYVAVICVKLGCCTEDASVCWKSPKETAPHLRDRQPILKHALNILSWKGSAALGWACLRLTGYACVHPTCRKDGNSGTSFKDFSHSADYFVFLCEEQNIELKQSTNIIAQSFSVGGQEDGAEHAR